MPIIHLLLPDQNDALRSLDAPLSAFADFDAASRFLVARVEVILGVPAAVLEQLGGRWRVAAAAGLAPPAPALIDAARRALPTLSDPAQHVTDTRLENVDWTAILLRQEADRVVLLMLSGDWTLSRLPLRDIALRIGASLGQPPGSPTWPMRRQSVAVYTLAARLAQVADGPGTLQIITSTCAEAIGADKVSVALFDPARGSLNIVATFGYPSVLVKHVRIRPGEAVIGRVFQTGRSLRVDDIGGASGATQPRLRYRTNTFIAVPLVIRNKVVGVLSVTDPEAGRFAPNALRRLRALSGVVSLALDRVQALEEAHAHARVAAIDPLTGLFNRRYFLSRLHEEVERSRRQTSPLSLLILDVDNFKQLNDRLGHGTGDAVLRVAGDVLHSSVRSFDVCARYGGDEFAILMPGCNSESARQIADRIRSGVEAARPSVGRGADDLKVTISIGLTTFAGASAEDLIERADEALYAAKRGGKNRVHATGMTTDGEPS